MEIDLPNWAFDAARFLCEQRAGKFRNRFASAKLRGLHGDEPYFRHSEGIIGYLGDIGAAIALGLDPIVVLEEMIVATDGLAHRDQFDLFFRGWHIDAKVEDFSGHHDAVIAGGLRPTDPYGCRLINAVQYSENKGFTDIYLFGCFNPPMGTDRLLHDIGRVRWLGWVTAELVERCGERGFTPAGARLPMKARLVPDESLRPMSDLVDLAPGSRIAATFGERAVDARTAERIATLRAELRAICDRP